MKGRFLLLTIVIFTHSAFSQLVDSQNSIKTFNLQEVILLAKAQSPAYFQAINLKETKYWQWRTFKSNYRPQLSIAGTLPNFTRAYTPIVQPEGDIKFQSVSNASSDLRLNLSQSIGITGGSIFLSSLLRRFDNFQKDHVYDYSGNPVVIGFSQQLFGLNELRWEKRIGPLKYEESQKEYLEALESISVAASDHFFNLLLAQTNLEMAEINRVTNDTIYKIALRRYDLGKIFENELLQLELTLLNSKQAVSRAKLELETHTLALKVFAGIIDEQLIKLIIPENITFLDPSEEVALNEARKNRANLTTYHRRLIEAEREVAVARSNNGLRADLTATFGYTNRASDIVNLYNSPKDQQELLVTFQVPILDWGRSKSRMKTAEANNEYIQNMIEQDKLNFDQEVYTQVRLFKMLRDQMKIAAQADEIGLKRYALSKERFLIGKITITDLNIALQEKDNAKRSYIKSLHDYWKAFFELRRITLYDFEKNHVISE